MCLFLCSLVCLYTCLGVGRLFLIRQCLCFLFIQCGCDSDGLFGLYLVRTLLVRQIKRIVFGKRFLFGDCADILPYASIAQPGRAAAL
jgi:hypothetical protein